MSKIFSKSGITNVAAILVLLGGIILSYSFNVSWATYIINMGMFALSGSVTNWLAIHMLFEKVPFLYGSGVILNKFEEFRYAIKKMIIDNFFTEEQFDTLTHSENPPIETQKLLKYINEDEIFDTLVEVFMQSSMGSMLNMFGGSAIIEKLRPAFLVEIRKKIESVLATINWSEIMDTHLGYEMLYPKIIQMIDNKLAELTPQLVKNMIAEVIKVHLGWLVVWGGVFGGLIGIISTVVYSIISR